MKRPVWKYVALAGALLGALVVGAVAGGGLVYAMVGPTSPIRLIPVSRGDAAAVPLVVAKEADPVSDPEDGIVIASVAPGSPADGAGLERGDILLAIDDHALEDYGDVLAYLAEAEAGDEVELTVRHGDEVRILEATLEGGGGRAYLGIVPCSGGVPAAALRIRGAGTIITRVVEGSPAEEAGLQAGDIVVSVDGRRLDRPNGLADTIGEYEPGDAITLLVMRAGDEELEITVELGEHPDQAGVPYLGVEYRAGPAPGLLERGPIPFGRLEEFGLDLGELEEYGLDFGELEHFEFELGDLGRFGLDLDELPFDLAHEGVLRGAVVMKVVEDSPASAAGIEEGDIITAVDGEPVGGPGGMVDAIAQHEPGDTSTLTIIEACCDDDSEHEGEGEHDTQGESEGESEHGTQDETEVDVKLGEHPEREGEAYLGVFVGSFLRVRRGEDGEARSGFRFRLPDLRRLLPFGEGSLEREDIPRRFEFRWPPRGRAPAKSPSV